MIRPEGSNGPLNHHQWVAAIDALRLLHKFNTTAHLVTLDGEQGPDLPPLVGQDNQGQPSQVNAAGGGMLATASFNDPDRKLRHLEGAHIRHYILRCYYQWFVPALPDWVSVPVFTGGADTCTRDNNLVSITARSKFTLGRGVPREPFKIAKGTQITEAIRIVMSKAGDARAQMQIQDHPRELKEDFWIGHEGNRIVGNPGATWVRAAKTLAAELDPYLLYERQDGALVGKRPPTKPEWFVFSDDFGGDNDQHGFVTSMRVTHDFTDFANLVLGRWSKDLSKIAHVRPPKSNPLAGNNPGMMRNGEEFWAIAEREYPNARNENEVLQHLRDVLRRSLSDVVKAEGTCFPMPCLEYGDIYPFATRDYHGKSTIGNWSLPLGGGQDMTIGFNDFDVIGPL